LVVRSGEILCHDAPPVSERKRNWQPAYSAPLDGDTCSGVFQLQR
jgi:hypothetical protein